MTESENSLRIINSLPGRIIFKGNYYMLMITKIDFGGDVAEKYGLRTHKWYVEYQRVFMSHETVFKAVDSKIEDAAWKMYELLVENKLI